MLIHQGRRRSNRLNKRSGAAEQFDQSSDIKFVTVRKPSLRHLIQNIYYIQEAGAHQPTSRCTADQNVVIETKNFSENCLLTLWIKVEGGLFSHIIKTSGVIGDDGHLKAQIHHWFCSWMRMFYSLVVITHALHVKGPGSKYNYIYHMYNDLHVSHLLDLLM